jgi:hypothetical protein
MKPHSNRVCRQPGALLAIEGGILVCDLANSKLRKIVIKDAKAVSEETLVGPAKVDMPVNSRISPYIHTNRSVQAHRDIIHTCASTIEICIFCYRLESHSVRMEAIFLQTLETSR